MLKVHFHWSVHFLIELSPDQYIIFLNSHLYKACGFLKLDAQFHTCVFPHTCLCFWEQIRPMRLRNPHGFLPKVLNFLHQCSELNATPYTKPDLGNAAERSVTASFELVQDFRQRKFAFTSKTYCKKRSWLTCSQTKLRETKNNSNCYKISLLLTFYSYLILLGKYNSLLKAGVFKFPEELNTFWMTFH